MNGQHCHGSSVERHGTGEDAHAFRAEELEHTLGDW